MSKGVQAQVKALLGASNNGLIFINPERKVNWYSGEIDLEVMTGSKMHIYFWNNTEMVLLRVPSNK